MSALTDTRAELAQLATAAAGMPVTAHLGPKLTPPGGFVIPGSPYLTKGSTFGAFLIRLEVHLAVGAVNNETATQKLDPALEELIVAAATAGWGIEDASQPYALKRADGAQFLAAGITVTKTIHL